MSTEEKLEKLRLASKLFAPRFAITKSDHLAGRKSQIGKLINAIFQAGAHAIVFGERGVGKTSLANCIRLHFWAKCMTTELQTKSMRDYVATPSAAVQAMIDGLLKMHKDPNFEIRMDTYGSHVGGICFGCAATCCIQEACGVRFTPQVIISIIARSDLVGVHDMYEFELAINDFRKGYPASLFAFYGMKSRPEDDHRIYLETGDWLSEIPKIQTMVDDWEAMGW